MEQDENLNAFESIFARALHDEEFRGHLLAADPEEQKAALLEAGVPDDRLDQAVGSLNSSVAALQEFGEHFGAPVQAA